MGKVVRILVFLVDGIGMKYLIVFWLNIIIVLNIRNDIIVCVKFINCNL